MSGEQDKSFGGRKEDDLPEGVEQDAVATQDREEMLLHPTRDGIVLALVYRGLDPAVLFAQGDIFLQKIRLEVRHTELEGVRYELSCRAGAK